MVATSSFTAKKWTCKQCNSCTLRILNMTSWTNERQGKAAASGGDADGGSGHGSCGHAGGRSGHSSDGKLSATAAVTTANLTMGSDEAYEGGGGEFYDGESLGMRPAAAALRWMRTRPAAPRPAAAIWRWMLTRSAAQGPAAAMNADEASSAEAGCGPTHVVELAASAAGALALLQLQRPMHSGRRAGVEPLAEDAAPGGVGVGSD